MSWTKEQEIGEEEARERERESALTVRLQEAWLASMQESMQQGPKDKDEAGTKMHQGCRPLLRVACQA